MNAEAPTGKIKVWDLPLRIFHWLLVAAVTAAIVTAKVGGEWMEWHGKAGMAIIGLLVFRLAWGVVGTVHARFTSFAPTPARVLAYLKGQWQGRGHNPLGALSVFAMLGLLAAQAISGLFCNDDIAFNGPLFGWVDKDLSDRITGWHHLLSNYLLAFLALHIGAVLFYLVVKKHNLIKPMLTGWAQIPNAQQLPSKRTAGGVVALLSSVMLAWLAWHSLATIATS